MTEREHFAVGTLEDSPTFHTIPPPVPGPAMRQHATPPHPAASSLLLAALLLGCGAEEPAARSGATVDTLPGGATRIVSASPRDSARWHLTLLRDIRPPAGDPGELQAPEDLAVGDDGTVLVVETKPVAVKRYDADGRFLGTIGREGEGPGEYRSARVAVHRDTLIVADPQLDRLVLFAPDGRLLATQPTPCCMSWYPLALDSLGRLLGSIGYRIPEGGGRVAGYVRRALTGAVLDTLWRMVPPPDPSAAFVVTEAGKVVGSVPVPFRPELHWAVAPDGRLVVGDGARHELRTTTDGLDTVRLASRPLTAVPLDAAARRATVEAMIARDKRVAPEGALRAAFDASRLPSVLPFFDRIWVDRAGRRWVHLARPAGAAARLDLFDDGGRWLDEVALPAGGWPSEPRTAPIAFGRDLVAVVLQDEEGAPFVRVYRIDRR